MKKPKRKKILKADLENRLSKFERRIQRLAEQAYKIRQAIEIIDSLPTKVPLTKEEREKTEKVVIEAAKIEGIGEGF